MRTLICGGRDYADRMRVEAVLDKLHTDAGIDLLIQGGANGADKLASDWAYSHRIAQLQFNAEWENFGTMAGPMRNKRMLEEGRPDVVIAFPGNKGTRNMIAQALRHGVKIVRIAP